MPLSGESKIGLHISSHSLVALPSPSPQMISDLRDACWWTRFLLAASRAARPESWEGAPSISLDPLNDFVTCKSTDSCSDRALFRSLISNVLKDMRNAFSLQSGGFKCLHFFTALSLALPIFFKKWPKNSTLTLVWVKWHHLAEMTLKHTVD